MNAPSISLIWATAILFAGMLCSALSAPLRVAIIDNGNNKDLAAVLNVEFSRNSGVELIERDEIGKIVREKELESLLARRDFDSLGKLLKADGLIILGNAQIGKQELVTIRFVTVNLGVVLEALALPKDSSSVSAQGAQVLRSFSSFIPKLKLSDPAKSKRLSLLGLRYDLNSPTAKIGERSINTLLAVQLSHYPTVFVLERWQLDKLSWEKSLDALPESAFWTGSSLIDGSVHEEADKLDVTIRIRNSESDPGHTIQCSGNKNDLIGLTDLISKKVITACNLQEQPLTWNRVDEASNYTQMAKWAYQNSLYDDSVSACHTALALNPNDSSASDLLIRSWSHKACGESSIDTNLLTPPVYQPDRMPGFVDAARQALLAVKDHAAHFETAIDWNSAGSEAITAAVKVLRSAHHWKYHLKDPGSLRQLRTTTREVISLLSSFDKSGKSKLVHLSRGEYFAYWTESPEETLLRYKMLMSRNKEYYPDTSIKTVNLISWNEKNEERLPQMWRDYVNDLIHSQVLYEQSEGYLVQYNGCENATYGGSISNGLNKRTAYTHITQFLWDNRDAIADGKLDIKRFRDVFSWELENGDTRTVQAAQAQLLIYLLGKSSRVELHTFDQMFLISKLSRVRNNPSFALKSELAAELLATFEQYEKRLSGSTDLRRDSGVIATMKRTCELELKNQAAPTVESGTKFKVSRFWSTFSIPELQKQNLTTYRNAGPKALIYSDGRVWFENDVTELIGSVDLRTFQTELLPWPEEVPVSERRICLYGGGLAVAKDSIFLIGNIVRKYDKATRMWSKLDLPPSMYGGTIIDGALYLSFDRDYGGVKPGQTLGLLKVYLETNKTEVLLSSRRTPPANSFERKMKDAPFAVFKGPGNALCLYDFGPARPGSVYRFNEKENDWQMLISGNHFNDRVSTSDEGALFNNSGSDSAIEKVYWMGRHATDRELLLQNPDRSEKDIAEPRWNFPPEFGKTYLDTSRCRLMAMDRGDLWILAWDVTLPSNTGTNLKLYFFGKEAKEGVEIPLELKLPEQQLAEFPQSDLSHIESDTLFNSGRNLIVAPEGLVLPGGLLPGFWFIPRREIEAYIKNVARVGK